MLTDETRRARRSHRCDICGDAIDLGTTYRYTTAPYEGHWYVMREHIACARLGAASLRWQDTDEGGYDTEHVEAYLAELTEAPALPDLDEAETARAVAFWQRVRAEAAHAAELWARRRCQP